MGQNNGGSPRERGHLIVSSLFYDISKIFWALPDTHIPNWESYFCLSKISRQELYNMMVISQPHEAKLIKFNHI